MKAIAILLLVMSVPAAIFWFGRSAPRILPAERSKDAATAAIHDLGEMIGAASLCRLNSTAERDAVVAYIERPARAERKKELSDAFNAGMESGIEMVRQHSLQIACNAEIPKLLKAAASSRALLSDNLKLAN